MVNEIDTNIEVLGKMPAVITDIFSHSTSKKRNSAI